MALGTIWEFLVLWILISVIGCFLGGKKIFIPLNVIIVVLIIAGFFIGIGIRIFNSLI